MVIYAAADTVDFSVNSCASLDTYQISPVAEHSVLIVHAKDSRVVIFERIAVKVAHIHSILR